MPPFLLDANLSPKVGRFFSRRFGFDVRSLYGALRDLPDGEVIEIARAQRRVIITLDRDFADRFAGSNRPPVGVIYLDLRNSHRTVAAINVALERFFREDAPGLVLDGALTVVSEPESHEGV